MPNTTFPVASSLIALLSGFLSPFLLCFRASSLHLGHAPAEQRIHWSSDQPENKSHPLILSPNYLWILGELFLPTKVKFLKLSLPLLLPVITLATGMQSSEPTSTELLEKGDMVPPLSRLMWH